MIFAWTVFIWMALLTLGSLVGAVAMFYAAWTISVNEYGTAALGYALMTIIFVVGASLAAQYIWGGGGFN